MGYYTLAAWHSALAFSYADTNDDTNERVQWTGSTYYGSNVAINQIEIFDRNASNFVVNSRVTLYGIG